VDAAASCDAGAVVSFAAKVKPILVGCTGETCHDPWSYESLVNQPSTRCCDGRLLVAPGDPAHSHLLKKLEGHDECGGAAMPPGAMLPADQIEAVAAWICEGAPDN
jgi:hypothetical protein